MTMGKYTSIEPCVWNYTNIQNPMYNGKENEHPEKWKVHNSALKGIRHKANKSHKSSISQDAKINQKICNRKEKTEVIATLNQKEK